jgi:hypothetical protein
MFHPDGGVIDPERAMAAMRAIAAARGAQVCYGTPVLRVEADGEGAAVHTADRSWRAPWWSPPHGWSRCSWAGAAAAAGRDPGGGLPLRPALAGLVRFIYYGDGVMYGLLAGRDGRCRHDPIGAHHGGGGSQPGMTVTGSSAPRPGSGPSVSSGTGCPAWTRRRPAR